MITPVLDVMQTMPTFVYLLPVVLFFGIGAVRRGGLHAHLRAAARSSGSPATASATVSPTTIEATDSPARPAGSGCARCSCRWRARPSSSASTRPRWRRCRWRRIAAFVNGPGPRQAGAAGADPHRHRRRVRARRADRGDGDHARPHHDGGQRAGRDGSPRGGERPSRRAGSCWRSRGVAALVAVYLSRTARGRREFPETDARADGSPTASTPSPTGSPTPSTASPAAIKDVITDGLLNPLQSLLAESPW